MASTSHDQAMADKAKGLSLSHDPKRKDKDGDISMSDSSGDKESDSGNEEDWKDVNAADDHEDLPLITSLVDGKTFTNPLEMLEYCKTERGLDFLDIRARLRLDFVECIRLVNFVRTKVRDGQSIPSTITVQDLESDDLMMPVLANDGFIVALDDLPELPPLTAEGQGKDVEELLNRNRELEEEMEKVKQQFMLYRESVAATLDKRWGISSDSSADANGAGPSGKSATKPEGKGKPVSDDPSMKEIMKREMAEEEDNEVDYFDSYAGLEIHETMIKDTVRTDAYRDFIYDNKHLFANKTVLDVGCGTGILSMFAARAGASRVIAVDNSDIARMARENVRVNGLDKIVTVVQGKMEEIILPGGIQKVDIIVSEWMGYCLTYEAMLPSVLWARNRYLAPGGLMVPSHATLRLAPISGAKYVEDSVDWWHDVYGFDMHLLPEGRKKSVIVTMMERGDVAGDAVPFRVFDLRTVTTSELEFSSRFETRLERGISGLEGWGIWFDMFFSPTAFTSTNGSKPAQASSSAVADGDLDMIGAEAVGRLKDEKDPVFPEDTPESWVQLGQNRVAFTTGPEGKRTHWEQGLLLVGDSRKEYEEGDDLIGEIEFKHLSDNRRHLEIKMTWESRVEGKKERRWHLG